MGRSTLLLPTARWQATRTVRVCGALLVFVPLMLLSEMIFETGFAPRTAFPRSILVQRIFSAVVRSHKVTPAAEAPRLTSAGVAVRLSPLI